MKRPRHSFAKKSLGQNFLIDGSVIVRIIDSLDLKPDDTVLEIGPGRGALTELLVETRSRVIAVEIDRDLVPELRRRFDSYSNFEVIEADILESGILKDLAIDANQVKVVGNLPYYISTPIVQKLIEQRASFERAILMLQREVVDRLTAAPGNSERGFITVITENAFKAQKLFDVPPEAFLPAPKVWSSVMKLTPIAGDNFDQTGLNSLVSLGFSQKRKTILNNLKSRVPNAAELLENSEIDPSRRAETLTLAEWKQLAKVIGEALPSLQSDKI